MVREEAVIKNEQLMRFERMCDQLADEVNLLFINLSFS
jgi:hypothetical protein